MGHDPGGARNTAPGHLPTATSSRADYTRSALRVNVFQGALLVDYNASTMAKRKNPHAVALGRKGGKKGGPSGGKARWAGLSAEERSELMRKAVVTRWAKAKKRKR